MAVAEPISTIASGEQNDDQPCFPPDLFKESTWSLHDLKHLLEIGKGKDTVIYSATCPRLGGRVAAVKVYDRTKVAATKLRAIKREIAMMLFFQRKRVPNVVDIYAAFQDENFYYIVMEYCPEGDLLEHLLRDRKAMSERRTAATVARPLLTTLQRLHDLRVIHRDIKLENIFLDAGGRVRLGDFGLTMSMIQEAAISPVGTVEYMSPEVVALPPVDMVTSGRIKAADISPTNEKVDIWALGVTLYELVTGRLPFEGADKPEIKAAITTYKLSPFPTYVSAQCQSMIRAMLAYEPTKRPTAAELLNHPWIQAHIGSSFGGAFAPPAISLEARAGPPRVPMSPGSANMVVSSGSSPVAAPYKEGLEASPPRVPPADFFTIAAMAMTASSREVSSSSLAQAAASAASQQRLSGYGHANAAAAAAAVKAETGAWAALTRMSNEQCGAGVKGAKIPVAAMVVGEDEDHRPLCEERRKSGVRGVVKRLFSRQSGVHS